MSLASLQFFMNSKGIHHVNVYRFVVSTNFYMDRDEKLHVASVKASFITPTRWKITMIKKTSVCIKHFASFSSGFRKNCYSPA